MKEAMEQFDSAMEEMMDMCKAELGRFMFEEDVDERAFEFMRTSLKLVNTAMNLMKAQTNTMIEMNEKLDALTKK